MNKYISCNVFYARFSIAVIIIFVLMFTIAPTDANAINHGSTPCVFSKTSIVLNGQLLELSAYNIGGNNYYMLKDLARILMNTSVEFNMSYDSENQRVDIHKKRYYFADYIALMPKQQATAILSNDEIYADNVKVDVIAYKIGGNNYYKLRDLAKVLDFQVEWDGKSRHIILNTPDWPSVGKNETIPVNENSFNITVIPIQLMTAELEQIGNVRRSMQIRKDGRNWSYPKEIFNCSELIAYLKKAKVMVNSFLGYEEQSISIGKYCSRFNDEFFKNKRLFIMNSFEGSSSIQYSDPKMFINDNYLIGSLKKNIPSGEGTSDMAYYAILIEVDRNLSKDKQIEFRLENNN